MGLTNHPGPMMGGKSVQYAALIGSPKATAATTSPPFVFAAPSSHPSGALLVALHNGIGVPNSSATYSIVDTDGAAGNPRSWRRTADNTSADTLQVTGAFGSTSYRGLVAAFALKVGAVITFGTYDSTTPSPLGVGGVTATGPGIEHLLVGVNVNSAPSNPISTPAGWTPVGVDSINYSGSAWWWAAVFSKPVAGSGSTGTTNVTVSGSGPDIYGIKFAVA